MNGCVLCPRMCGATRNDNDFGYCGQSRNVRIARASLHMFEEPPISGTRGSGTVFFCGCTLGCVFCQNKKISHSQALGRVVTYSELADIFLELEAKGAHNINLVTPTHFTDSIVKALESVKNRLAIPIVWNTSGYERTETLRILDGLVDIYMPDFKYVSSEMSEKYSAAPDYREIAERSISEMFRQVGSYAIDDNGVMSSGMLVRHLILPNGRKDSIAVLKKLANIVPPTDILLSLMSQYTPIFAKDSNFTELHRKITTFEYDSVAKEALSLGFDGFLQEKTSATDKYTPDFENS